MYEILETEDFKNLHPGKRTTYFKKRKELLIDNFDNLRVGDIIVCVEDREKSRYGSYRGVKSDGTYKKLDSITYAKTYKVLKLKLNYNVKLLTDDGAVRWFSGKRFLFSLKEQRKRKLQKLQKI